ncbi:MAG: hypothetical protein RhofKO_26280 [Rhodothermales bacterium]
MEYFPDLSSVPLDPYWNVFIGFDTHADFEALAAKVAFRSEVPRDVVGRFELVCRALRLAAIDMRMIDAALSRSLLTLELALSHRHDELGGPLRKRQKTLQKLIDWCGSMHLFENGAKAVHAARKIRNDIVAHPQRDSRLYMLGINIVDDITKTINELYEDPILRKARNDARAQLQQHLSIFSQNGALIDRASIGKGRLIAFNAECLFVENRDQAEIPIHYLAIWPIFDPTPVNQGVQLSDPILLCAKSWSYKESILTLETKSTAQNAPNETAPIKIELLSDPKHVRQYKSWRDQLDEGPVETQIVMDSTSASNRRIRSELIACQSPFVSAPSIWAGSVNIPTGGSATITFSPGEKPSTTINGSSSSRSN